MEFRTPGFSVTYPCSQLRRDVSESAEPWGTLMPGA